MLLARFGAGDLAHVRLAISPLTELLHSLRALEDPAAQALHLPWIVSSRPKLGEIDMDLLRALQPTHAYTPDFVHPPPSTPLAEFEQELSRMTATSPDQVRAEVRRAYHGRSIPAVLRPLVDDPVPAIAQLADLLRAYWQRVLEPHWPRLRALLEGDILYRARRIADGGAERLFADIHPEARFAQDVLTIDKPFDATVVLDGRGLLLVPSAFVWPRLSAITKGPWQPTLMYPARGIATLWDPGRPSAPEALSALIGHRRALVLAALETPRSTTELAERLGLSPASVSQHLGVLRDAGLASAHRVGRVVLYMRSPTGERLAGDGPLDHPYAA
jgi:DNA-binding transcriptional ArsR family regulator